MYRMWSIDGLKTFKHNQQVTLNRDDHPHKRFKKGDKGKVVGQFPGDLGLIIRLDSNSNEITVTANEID